MGCGSFSTPNLRNVRYFVHYTRGYVAVGFASHVGSFISRPACIFGICVVYCLSYRDEYFHIHLERASKTNKLMYCLMMMKQGQKYFAKVSVKK